MKRETNQDHGRRLKVLLLAGVLAATAGCICIHVHVGELPESGPASRSRLAPPGGGTFPPLTANVIAQPSPATTTLFCGSQQMQVQAVTYVNLGPSMSPLGTTGFQGYVYDETAQANIPNTSFVLYYFVNTSIKCWSTNVTNDPHKIGFKRNGQLPYTFKIYWRMGATPAPAGNQLTLMGSWVP